MRSTIANFLGITPGLNVFAGLKSIVEELQFAELRSGGRVIMIGKTSYPSDGLIKAAMTGGYFFGDYEKYPANQPSKAFSGVSQVLINAYGDKESPENVAKSVMEAYESDLTSTPSFDSSTKSQDASPMPVIFLPCLTGLQKEWATSLINALMRLFPKSPIITVAEPTKNPRAKGENDDLVENKPLTFPDFNSLRDLTLLPATLYGTIEVSHREDEFKIGHSNSGVRRYLATRRIPAESSGVEEARTFILDNTPRRGVYPITELFGESAWDEYATVSAFLRPSRRGYKKSKNAKFQFQSYINERYLVFVNHTLRDKENSLYNEARFKFNTIHGAMFLEAYAKELDSTDFSIVSPRFDTKSSPDWLMVPQAIREAIIDDFIDWLLVPQAKSDALTKDFTDVKPKS